MKKFLSFIIVLCMIIVSMPMSVSATSLCTPDGNNTEAQNYSRWSSPVKSYLSKTNDGKIMRVQAGDSINGVLVEYYDTDYNILSNKIVGMELPIFGGFYESSSNYFLVTGKQNKSESDIEKNFCVTKYDKNWNKLGSVSLYNVNTIEPFSSGSLRMTMNNNILFVHTSRKMYQSNDGTNHQANIIFSVDVNQMKLLQCNTASSNTSVGFVSHSFNQFVQMDGNNMVTVDHGDAYPRSIVLIKHTADASKGLFGSGCVVTDLLKFPGVAGDNYTGASVGGFEISSSSYLIAGNTVEQNDNYANNKTRNIFVASVKKSDETNSVTINKITNYAEGEVTASTPHFVKIANDEYMIMWSRNNTVYYTIVDRNGEQISNIYTMNGNLSDCAPTVINDKLVWYVWNGKESTFYEIDLNLISSNNAVTVQTGHDYEFSNVSDVISTLKCKKCGETTTTIVPTAMVAYWASGADTSGYYYDYLPQEIKVGDTLKSMLYCTPATDRTNLDFDVIISDKSIMSYEYKDSYPYPSYNAGYFIGEFKCLKPGTTDVTFKHKYNPQLTSTHTITVTLDPTDVSFEQSTLSMNLGNVHNLTPIFTPDGASSNCVWSSSDDSVATVDETGAVTAKGIGTTIITLTTANGLTTSCTVTVRKPILGDVNGDGEITVKDVILILQYNIGKVELDDIQEKYADLDSSGKINVIDAILLQKLIVQ